ncbi:MULTISPECIES: hypothetical protein [unclassified Pseudomonas]|uniref:hypothetical protein n=1 Tax=unclassified Pseudomonas TaxID=196821 RepID=UPI00249C6D3E|nr:MULTISPECIES: hypothetical protein [unclassified Pseudomonas]MEB0192422.1 hypothetical protein [Pseudomonas sp. CCI1.1]WPX48185.1 hypothetical protein RHM69_28425 [Pseudomonas sp. CCI1.1]
MNVDMDTDDWLGCPTPLEMYQHQCALLEDELNSAYQLLTRARANIAGLVQMNDLLLAGKSKAEASLKRAQARLLEIGDDPSGNHSFRPIDTITEQRDHLFRENQRLLLELKVYRGPPS